MKHLILRATPECDAEFLTDMMFSMPNLSALEVHDAETEVFDELLCGLEFLGKKWKIFESLQIIRPANLEDYQVQRLSMIGKTLKLKSFGLLSVVSEMGGLSSHPLETLFLSLAPTLTELKTPFFQDRPLLTPLQIPVMEKLKKLCMEDSSALGPLTFVNEKLPNLETLQLQFLGVGNGKPCPVIPFTTPHYQLSHLSLPNDFDDGLMVRHILQGFPNIRKLQVLADDSILQDIYELAPYLTELLLYPNSTISDYGLTGLSLEQVKKICAQNYSFLTISQYCGMSKFSIANLKRKFTA
jgi:hypothetical protein